MTSRETWRKVFKQFRNDAILNPTPNAKDVRLVGCIDLLLSLVELDHPAVAKIFDTELADSLERTDGE